MLFPGPSIYTAAFNISGHLKFTAMERGSIAHQMLFLYRRLGKSAVNKCDKVMTIMHIKQLCTGIHGTLQIDKVVT